MNGFRLESRQRDERDQGENYYLDPGETYFFVTTELVTKIIVAGIFAIRSGVPMLEWRVKRPEMMTDAIEREIIAFVAKQVGEEYDSAALVAKGRSNV